MELFLSRTRYRNTCVITPLFIDNNVVKECYILENLPREIPGIAPHVWKRPDGRNAVPVGRYAIGWTYSPHFQHYTPELMNVPGFTGVRIHGGNTDLDSDGCLITGSYIGMDNEGVILSDDARDKLYAKIRQAIINHEPVWITIS